MIDFYLRPKVQLILTGIQTLNHAESFSRKRFLIQFLAYPSLLNENWKKLMKNSIPLLQF